MCGKGAARVTQSSAPPREVFLVRREFQDKVPYLHGATSGTTIFILSFKLD